MTSDFWEVRRMADEATRRVMWKQSRHTVKDMELRRTQALEAIGDEAGLIAETLEAIRQQLVQLAAKRP